MRRLIAAGVVLVASAAILLAQQTQAPAAGTAPPKAIVPVAAERGT